MRAAFAPFRAAILSVVWLGLGSSLGCGAAARGTPVGMSDAVPERARATPPAESPHVAWPDFAAARAWPSAGPAFAALAHRRDGTLVRVAVEPSSLVAYSALAADAPMPDGARVVAWHETPGGQLLGGYLLEKHAGAWSALEIDAKGGLVVGDHTACLRCHDMAPTDHLFGSRVSPPAAPVGGESIDPIRR